VFPVLEALSHEKFYPRDSKIEIWDGPKISLNIWENIKTTCRYQDLNRDSSPDQLWKPTAFPDSGTGRIFAQVRNRTRISSTSTQTTLSSLMKYTYVIRINQDQLCEDRHFTAPS
jgi:hypothetical protein